MNKIMKSLRLGLSVVALAAMPWLGPFQQPEPEPGDEAQIKITQVDESQFPVIKVYVSVTDAAGEPVGVAPDRILLSENGAAMTPDAISGEGEIGPLTTLLVMDVSGSMNEAGKLEAAKAAARAYVDQMRPGDQAGLVTFNTEINYVQPVTTDREALAKAIDSLKAENDTAMYDALAQGAQTLSGIEGRKAIIVLTDGLDNRSAQTADQVIEQIGPSGLSISTIGLGDVSLLGVSNAGLDEAALKWLADRAGGTYGYADDPDSLLSLYERYGRALQSEYVLTFTSPSTLRDGVNRTLTVSLGEAGASAAADYNPGGVVPEVPERAPWTILALALAGLLALLFAPMLISRGLEAARNPPPVLSRFGKKKRSRIRLTDQPETKTQPRVRLR
jgi:VWFA-related protein